MFKIILIIYCIVGILVNSICFIPGLKDIARELFKKDFQEKSEAFKNACLDDRITKIMILGIIKYTIIGIAALIFI